MVWDGLVWLRIGISGEPSTDPNDHGEESSSSLKFWAVLETLRNWRSLEKGTAPWLRGRIFF
jgi:hypothetical protein